STSTIILSSCQDTSFILAVRNSSGPPSQVFPSETSRRGEVVRMKFMKLKITVLIVCTLFCLPAWSEVKVVLAAHKIVKTNGTEQSVSGDKAKPGDVIEYVATYKNTDTKPATNVTATLPIPRGMEYIPNTASPESVMASTDDAHYAVVPLKRMVKDANG